MEGRDKYHHQQITIDQMDESSDILPVKGITKVVSQKKKKKKKSNNQNKSSGSAAGGGSF